MDLISQVTLMGGVTDRATIIRLRGAREVDRALRAGTLVRDARGRYALPAARQGIRTASSIAGVLSHRSAAHYWGWAQKKPDGLPEVTVPRNRRVDPALRRRLIPHWSDLPPEDIVKGMRDVAAAHAGRLHAQPPVGRGARHRRQRAPRRRHHQEGAARAGPQHPGSGTHADHGASPRPRPRRRPTSSSPWSERSPSWCRASTWRRRSPCRSDDTLTLHPDLADRSEA